MSRPSANGRNNLILRKYPAAATAPVLFRMLTLLADGLPHHREELRKCLSDPEYGDPATVWHHVSRLRKILNPRGEEVVCEFRNRRIFYRHIKLLKWVKATPTA